MDRNALLRRQTRAFVLQKPTFARMQGYEEVDRLDGGRERVKQRPRLKIMFTLVEPSSSGYGPPITDTSGSAHQVDYLLVAEYGTDVRLHDEFVGDDGSPYRVEDLMPDNGYEVRAYVNRIA